ncbi:MAG TPA: hypothetical protein P5564_08030 [Paludibacteraceae bacterium]|nr:hypothetical protein [Paludibacteraceae bacterium]
MENKTETVNSFFHYLRDMIILLGGDTEIANKVINTDEISKYDVDILRQYNINLVDQTKNRLAKISTMKIVVKGQ